MSNHIPVDYSMDDEDNTSRASYPSAASVSSARSGNAVLSGNYPRQHHQLPSFTATSFASDSTELSLKRDREREGRCSECGVQTHEFRLDRMTGRHIKVPLTMENEVHRGRCLLCYPIHPGAPVISVTGPSTRTLTTVSTLGNQSAPGNWSHHYSHPDYVESASIVTTSTAVDEALQNLEDEGSDLLDVLTAMRQFPSDRRIQEKGLKKLWIQSWDEDNSVAIGRVGGISTILHAMRSYASSTEVQQYGCEALQNLALNEYNRDFIGEHGGIQAVVQAMNIHSEVVGVQQAGCTALANLAVSRQHHMDIANAGGLHAIVRAAQAYSDEEHVLRAAYQALRAMGYNPQRHGEQARQQQQQQQSQQQGEDMQEEGQQAEQSRQQEENQGEGEGQTRNVIRLDAYGFPIDKRNA